MNAIVVSDLHIGSRFSLHHDFEKLLKNIPEDCALENGYEAVICGHTHYPEDRVYNGVRYLNTGAWTESPAFYLQMIGNEMTLNPIVSQKTPFFNTRRF